MTQIGQYAMKIWNLVKSFENKFVNFYTRQQLELWTNSASMAFVHFTELVCFPQYTGFFPF